MSIMAHLTEQNAITAPEKRLLPLEVVTTNDHLRLCQPHLDQLITLFEILCSQPAYQERLDAIDEFLNATRRQQDFLEAENLGSVAVNSRRAYAEILRRWREDIAPLSSGDGTFTDGPDPADHDPADTYLLPEECAA